MLADILGTSCDQCRSMVQALRPRKPEGSLGRTAQYGHLDSHTAPELYYDDDDDDKMVLNVLICRVTY